MASYITSQPHSPTNPTNMHRVVKFRDWHKTVYGNGDPLVPVSVHLTCEAALAACAKLNKQERETPS